MDQNLLKLFIVANTPSADTAIKSVTEMCEKLLSGKWQLEIIDVISQADKAEEELITAVPALTISKTTKRLVGDLSNPEDIIIALGLKESS